ncbi:MAG: site-2 protease family protein [Marmoricola sp.]
MTPVYYILGVLIFVVALLASVGLHECGHMVPAKRFGVRVPHFFIGFGKTLWSRQKGDTLYGIKALPLGGYVKIVGMFPPSKDGIEADATAEGEPAGLRLRQSNTGMFTQLISDARAAEWEWVRPEDTDRLFYKLTWWKKVVVMAGGPTVNLVIAFLIFGGVFATYGNPSDQYLKPVVSTVSGCVVPVAQEGRKCTAADPKSPALVAGLQPGDRLVSFNGTPVTSWERLQTQIRGNDNGRAVIVVERGGSQQTLTTNTSVTLRPDLVDTNKQVEVGFLGVSPTVSGPTTGGPIYTLTQMGTMTKDVGTALVQLPANVFKVAKAIVGLEQRDPEGPISIVGGGRIAGETAAAQNFPVKEKAVALLLLIAGFNFFIGMLNLVPLLPLDGGHIAGALYEEARRRLARLLKRPDPGHADVAKMLPIVYVVASILLVFGVVLMVGDIVVPVHLTS